MSDRDDTTDPPEDYDESEVLDQQQPDDTLVDRGVDDVLDEGYSAPEKWSPGEGYGTTELEQEEGETLDQRVEQEEPDTSADFTTEIPDDDEAGAQRAGRIVEPGDDTDREQDVLGEDAGIDAGAAGAEEAAVYTRDE